MGHILYGFKSDVRPLSALQIVPPIAKSKGDHGNVRITFKSGVNVSVISQIGQNHLLHLSDVRYRRGVPSVPARTKILIVIGSYIEPELCPHDPV